MAKKRFLVLVNPRGGARRGMAVLNEIRPSFQNADAELDVHCTDHAGHALELARTLDLTGQDGLCVIGGDGTIHEVINGLLQRPDPLATPLGLIPGGTGNSLVLHLGYGAPLEAVERILAGRTQAVDIARVTTCEQTVYCVNIVGWGAAVDINRTAERLRFIGRPRYTVAALCHILFPRRRRVRLVLDDLALDDDLLMVMGCNTQFTARGMRLAPRADLGDGKLDVIVVRRASFGQLLGLFRRVFNGSHVDLECVEYHQVQSLRIEPQTEATLNFDGELKGRSPAAVQMLPGAIRVFA